MTMLSEQLRMTCDWCKPRCEACRKIELQAADELDRLQAIVDRFRKTEDGTTIIPSMMLFSISAAGEIWEWIAAEQKTIDLIDQETQRTYEREDVRGLYATREAAEKAMGA